MAKMFWSTEEVELLRVATDEEIRGTDYRSTPVWIRRTCLNYGTRDQMIAGCGLSTKPVEDQILMACIARVKNGERRAPTPGAYELADAVLAEMKKRTH